MSIRYLDTLVHADNLMNILLYIIKLITLRKANAETLLRIKKISVYSYIRKYVF